MRGGALAERMVSLAERHVATELFLRGAEAAEPGTRAELRKELVRLRRFFGDVATRCKSISSSANALIAEPGGYARKGRFGEIADYFSAQAAFTEKALRNFPAKPGRERSSTRYLDALAVLASAHADIFGDEIQSSPGTPGYKLAQLTLRAFGVSVSGSHLAKMIKKSTEVGTAQRRAASYDSS